MTDQATEQETTALAVQEQSPTMALPSEHELGRMERIATALAQSDIVPVAYRRRPADILAACLAGRELGLSPMSAMQRIYVIDGRPTLSSEAMSALVQGAGHEIWVDPESNDQWATAYGVRKGSDRQHQITFTMDEAKAAGITGKKNWKAYPKAMLRARAISALCRVAFADVLAGYTYTPEEMGAVTADDGSVIEAAVVEAPPANGHPAWLVDLLERFGWDTVRPIVQAMIADANLSKEVNEPADIRTLPDSWVAEVTARLERAADDVQARPVEDGDVVDAEVVEVEHPCPHCGSECVRQTKETESKTHRWWQCTNDDCDGGEIDGKPAPWTSFHNDPWKPGGQIETEFKSAGPDADANPLASSGSGGEPVAEGGDEAATSDGTDAGPADPSPGDGEPPDDHDELVARIVAAVGDKSVTFADVTRASALIVANFEGVEAPTKISAIKGKPTAFLRALADKLGLEGPAQQGMDV